MECSLLSFSAAAASSSAHFTRARVLAIDWMKPSSDDLSQSKGLLHTDTGYCCYYYYYYYCGCWFADTLSTTISPRQLTFFFIEGPQKLGLLPCFCFVSPGPLRFGSVDTLLPPCALIEGFLLLFLLFRFFSLVLDFVLVFDVLDGC